MAKTVEKLYEIGAKAKRKIGEETDNHLLKAIKENPGCTPYYLTQELGWQVGKVDGSLRRLQKRRKVTLKQVLKHSRVVKKIYPADHQPKHPSIIEIPMKMLANPEAWLQKEVIIYAITRSSIGLTPDPIESWEHKAWRKFHVKAERINENIRLKLPEVMMEFYGLWNSEVGLSTSRNETLLTIEATLIPMEESLPHPDEPGLHTGEVAKEGQVAVASEKNLTVALTEE